MKELEPNRERVVNSSYLQKLELEKIRMTQFDRFDGEQIAHDLEDNRELWLSAMLTSYAPNRDRQELDALKWGETHYDTLLLETNPDFLPALDELAQQWNPDSLDWLTEKDMDPDSIDSDIPSYLHVVRASWWRDGLGTNPESWAGDTMGGGIR